MVINTRPTSLILWTDSFGDPVKFYTSTSSGAWRAYRLAVKKDKYAKMIGLGNDSLTCQVLGRFKRVSK